MRGLSTNFFDSLNEGILQPILNRVKNDDTLMLSIRNGYINIYYRGGNLLKISELPNTFEMYFDRKYDLSEGHEVFKSFELPIKIAKQKDINKWISSFPVLKELMDFWLSENPKLEREFQQLVERENNRSSISNESEYFITDIELADLDLGARFDMTAIKWLANRRKDGRNCIPAFIEMKYGDNAVAGKAGLIKHIKDINTFLSNTGNYRRILDVMTNQFYQLDVLGMLKFNHTVNNTKVELSSTEKPEFIFLISNHNPRSTKLKSILTDPEFTRYIEPNLFSLLFYVNSCAGYGLHSANMISYEDYIKHL